MHFLCTFYALFSVQNNLCAQTGTKRPFIAIFTSCTSTLGETREGWPVLPRHLDSSVNWRSSVVTEKKDQTGYQ